MNEKTTQVLGMLKESSIPNGYLHLTILEGKALEQKPPNKITISGDIKSVANFLKVRKSDGFGHQEIQKSKAIIYIDKEERTIVLEVDPENHYGTVVKGKLDISDELKIFQINTVQKFSRQELVRLIKMNRIFFENKEKHSEMLVAFQKIESSVNYATKDGSDDRGNKERQYVKNVTTNAPMSFTLEIPIFKGFEAQPVTVEICLDIEEGTAKFWLESVHLNEIIQSSVDEIFREQLSQAEGFVVINR